MQHFPLIIIVDAFKHILILDLRIMQHLALSSFDFSGKHRRRFPFNCVSLCIYVSVLCCQDFIFIACPAGGLWTFVRYHQCHQAYTGTIFERSLFLIAELRSFPTPLCVCIVNICVRLSMHLSFAARANSAERSDRVFALVA